MAFCSHGGRREHRLRNVRKILRFFRDRLDSTRRRLPMRIAQARILMTPICAITLMLAGARARNPISRLIGL